MDSCSTSASMLSALSVFVCTLLRVLRLNPGILEPHAACHSLKCGENEESETEGAAGEEEDSCTVDEEDEEEDVSTSGVTVSPSSPSGVSSISCGVLEEHEMRKSARRAMVPFCMRWRGRGSPLIFSSHSSARARGGELPRSMRSRFR